MKFNLGRTFLLGFGFLGVSALWGIYKVFVPLLLSNKFHLPVIWVAFFLSLDNVAALLIQPPVSIWSDKIRTPIGRRMPFILVGAPLSALAFAFLPVAPILPLFVICTSTLLVSMSLWRTPVMALMADVTPSPSRSLASGIVSFMGGIGAIIAYFLGGTLYKINPAYPFWLGAVVVASAAMLLFVGVKESRAYETETPEIDESLPGFLDCLRAIFEDRDKSTLYLLGALFFLSIGYSALEDFWTLYAHNHLNFDAPHSARLLGQMALVFVLCAIPSGTLGARLGRRAVIMTGLGAMSALLLVTFLLPVHLLKTPLFSLPLLGECPLSALF